MPTVLLYLMEANVRRINGKGRLLMESGRRFPTSFGELEPLLKDKKVLGKRVAKKV